MNSTPPARERALTGSLRHLGGRLTAGEIPLNDFRAAVCEAFRTHFNCSRASLWRFVGEAPTRSLRCVGLFTAEAGFLQPGTVLLAEDYGAYLDQLLTRGTLASPDVMADPHLRELGPYFEATGVRSLMDTAFQINGEAFGVVCLEEIGKTRDWTAQEQSALREATFTISLAIARMGPRFDFDGSPPGIGSDHWL